MLRIVLMLAGFCFVLWGSLVLTKVAIDTVIWNAIFCLINAVRASELAWQRRPIKFDREEHEIVYAEVFEPVGISRLNFKSLIANSLIRTLRAGSTFIEAGNEATNLTLIYSGTMGIHSAPKDGRPSERVGSVSKMQFVESPQWANIQVQRKKKSKPDKSAISAHKSSIHPSIRKSLHVPFRTKLAKGAAKIASDAGPNPQGLKRLVRGNENTTDDATAGTDAIVEMDVALDEDVRAASSVDVTFKAETDVSFFTWPMEKLCDFLSKNPSISSPLNSIVGSDVATKLFSQAKAKDVALDRRIYMPLDEPRDEGLIPLVDDEGGEETGEEEETKSEKEESVGDGSTAIDVDKVSTLSVQRKPGLDRRSSIYAEKMWLEKRGTEDTLHDRKLAAILRQRTSLNKYEISALLSKGRWRHILREGTVLIREGEPTTMLAMILRGRLSVHKGEGDKISKLHSIEENQMVGSIELLETETEHIAGETVTSLKPVTMIVWDVDDLRALLAPRPRLRAQFTTLLAIDLAAKFRQIEKMV